MNKVFLAIVVTLLIGNFETDAQVKRSRPKQKQLIAAPAKTPLPAEYEINAVVVKGLGVFIVGISPLRDVAISNEKAFKSFLRIFTALTSSHLKSSVLFLRSSSNLVMRMTFRPSSMR